MIRFLSRRLLVRIASFAIAGKHVGRKGVGLFEVPAYNFSWSDLYRYWQCACREQGIAPSVSMVLEVQFEGLPDFAEEFDWIPLSAIESKVGPRRSSYKGISYWTTHATNASLRTASMLVKLADDKERLACFAILACAFQLRQCLPAYWRGIHNTSLLEEVCRVCRRQLADDMDWMWNRSSRRIFPEKFFSPHLLESISWLTERQIVALAALNLDYYLKQWVIIHYWYGMPFKDYLIDRQRRALSMARGFGEENAGEIQESQQSSEGMEEFACIDAALKNVSNNRDAGAEKGQRVTLASVRPMVGNRESAEPLSEGARKRKAYDAIERNRTARKICLSHYGYTCQVCGLNFEERFGSEFAEIVDVHHLKPLSAANGERLVDPISDLVPLCPNCHRMVHCGSTEPRSLEEVKAIVANSLGKA